MPETVIFNRHDWQLLKLFMRHVTWGKADRFEAWQNFVKSVESKFSEPELSAVQIVVMPAKLTAENGAKAALIGEFSEEIETMTECPRDGGCNEPECDGEYHTGMQHVPVEWSTIKAIYARAVEHFNVTR